MMEKKLRVFLPCYYSFFVNGMMVLMVGTMLPFVIAEAGINFSAAGALLSAFAVGNLLASFDVDTGFYGTLGIRSY